ncbi:MAG: YqgE/AlgH family protein [Nocardioidaceae bacterium]
MSSPDRGSLTGKLLVATPALVDPNFARSVVLVLDDDRSGTLGVVLNRPLDLAVDEVLPDWDGDVVEPESLFGGGPVAVDSALAVGVLAGGDGAGTPLGWRPMFGRVGLVDLDAPTEVLSGALSGLRIFAGYAGWTADQLHVEIEEGAWLVLEVHDSDILTAAPTQLWSAVLRRQPGELRLLSTYPPDPALN